MKEAYLIRREENSVQTLGHFTLYDGLLKIFDFYCLELPDRNNATSISRVLSGKYKCKKRWSKKYKWHYILEDVEGRAYILIHKGNYYTNTRGCILPGIKVADINGDGWKDVTSSQYTIDKLLRLAGAEFTLTILDN